MADAKGIGSIIGDANKETLAGLAQFAEGCEKWEDMCTIMKKLVGAGDDLLSEEQRNLLSVAFKNRVGISRQAHRAAIQDIEDGQIKGDQAKYVAYKDYLAGEVVSQCDEIIGILKDTLVPRAEGASDEEADKRFVFYTKMTADYHRYAAEACTDKTQYANGAQEFYQKAWDRAENLQSTSPIRLGLALNFSVCTYEILENKEKACEMAKNAFDKAISELDALPEEQYKDSTLIMQLLRDNLSLWTAETEE